MDSKEVRLRKTISNAMREYLGEAKQGSDNEEIQQLVDIVDNIDSDDERRMRYINILKTKYNYQYVESDDEDHINNANLDDIKTIHDFRNYPNYEIYTEKLLRLREKNVDYSKFYNYSPSSINKEQLIELLEKYGIKSYFTKRGAYSSPTGGKGSMSIDWAGETFDKSHVLHEVAHFFDDKILIPTTYSLTDYGLINQAECTCESIMLYLLNKNYYKSVLPKIGNYIEQNMPDWFVQLSNELLNIKE